MKKSFVAVLVFMLFTLFAHAAYADPSVDALCSAYMMYGEWWTTHLHICKGVLGANVFFGAFEYGFSQGEITKREWQYYSEGEWDEISPGGLGMHTYTATGNYTATFKVTTTDQSTYTDTCEVTVIAVDLDIDGMNEVDELTVGGLVIRNYDDNNAPRKKIIIRKAEPSDWTGDVLLTRNMAKVKVYTASTGGTELTFNGTDNKFANASLPTDLYVEGAYGSGSMRDVQLTVTPQDVYFPYSDAVKFTVLWVDQPTVKLSENEEVSSDNDKRERYKSWTINEDYKLGLQLYNDDFMGWGNEAGATVHPVNFNYPNNDLMMDRDCESRAWHSYNDTNEEIEEGRKDFSESIPWGNDFAFPPDRDGNPEPNGNIYALDTPALGTDGELPDGDRLRLRANFKAFASITIDDGSPLGMPVRCSEIRHYFVRFSMKQLDEPSGTNWVIEDTPDVQGDNDAGYGSTNISWDLQ